MSKAVLVIDMPESCRECPFFGSRYSDMACRAMNNKSIDYPYPKEFRQDWCPLKDLPKENVYEEYYLEWSRGYQSGWNDCINAIAGE